MTKGKRANSQTYVKLKLMPPKTQRGFLPIIIILIVALLLILGLVYYFAVIRGIFIPQKQSGYQNPFQKTPSYENPFTDYKNPFDNLK